MKKIILASAALAVSATASFAAAVPSGATQVPEISALEGTAALAALAAVLLLVWERRRRSA